MADIKISELGSAASVNDTDVIPMTASGVTVKATAALFKNYMGVGALSNLTTDDKTSLVNAVNEVNANADTANSKADNAQQMIAPIQTTLTASKSYVVNEEFIYDGNIYIVTLAISQGEAIIINGNCKLYKSVGAQLTSIFNALENRVKIRFLGTINNSSITKHFTDAVRGILLVSGSSSSRDAMFMIVGQPDGSNTYITQIYKGNDITVTSGTSGITITTSVGYGSAVYLMIYDGEIDYITP